MKEEKHLITSMRLKVEQFKIFAKVN